MPSEQHIAEGIAAVQAGLSPAFTGSNAWCNERMMLSDTLEAGVPLEEFFSDGGFEAAIATYARVSGGSDRRAVASMWSLYYFSALTIPFILARTLSAQVLPIGFEDMRLAVGKDGLPRAFGVPNPGHLAGIETETFAVIAPLVEAHLGQVVALLKAKAGISVRLGWNNAAVYIDYALRCVAPWSGEPADKPLLDGTHLTGGRANPFNDCLRYERDGDQSVCRRKLCCLRYLLPGIPSCGSLCALPEQRKLSA